MKFISIFIPILFLNINLIFSQNRVEGTDYTAFNIKQENDTIDFIIADTVLNVQKPILLFCQGSLPVPLFVDVGNNKIIPLSLSNFDLENIKKYYHLVVISMPKTPLIADIKSLSDQYYYLGDTINSQISKEFFLADKLENYVNRANIVLDYLSNKNFIDNSKLVVCGHSQGSRIAPSIAESNKNITHLGLFAYSYERRIDVMIEKIRVQAQKGEITWEKADSLQANLYDFYKRVQDDDSIKSSPHLTSWRSFSTTSIDELAKLKIPVYIANGTEDRGRTNTDIIPLYFIEQGKTNYVIRRYPGLDHNFFPIVDEKPDHKNGEWNNVMNEFIEWVENESGIDYE